MTASIVLPALALLTMLRFPLAFFPMLLIQFISLKVRHALRCRPSLPPLAVAPRCRASLSRLAVAPRCRGARVSARTHTPARALPHTHTRTHTHAHTHTHTHTRATDESHTRNPTPNIPCWKPLYEQILPTPVTSTHARARLARHEHTHRPVTSTHIHIRPHQLMHKHGLSSTSTHPNARMTHQRGTTGHAADGTHTAAIPAIPFRCHSIALRPSS